MYAVELQNAHTIEHELNYYCWSETCTVSFHSVSLDVINLLQHTGM